MMINQPLMWSIEYYFNFVNLFLSFGVLIEIELVAIGHYKSMECH